MSSNCQSCTALREKYDKAVNDAVEIATELAQLRERVREWAKGARERYAHDGYLPVAEKQLIEEVEELAALEGE
jgi:hypothetical protein